MYSVRLGISHLKRKMGRHPLVADRLALEERRQRLQKRIAVFESKAASYIPMVADADGDGTGEAYDGAEWDDLEEDVNPLDEVYAGEIDSGIQPESAVISLPSQLGYGVVVANGWEEIAAEELSLRVGQANDALHQIRLAIGYKSVLFRTAVRHANSQRQKLRSWDEVVSTQRVVLENVRIYSQSRRAILALNPTDAIRARFRAIHHDDLKAVTALLDNSVRGARQDTLSWIWTVDIEGDSTQSNWLTERECARHASYERYSDCRAQVHRVNWFRAKSRKDRWGEEYVMVTAEMDWTLASFRHKANTWRSRLRGSPGHICYARRQISLWTRMADHASSRFAKCV